MPRLLSQLMILVFFASLCAFPAHAQEGGEAAQTTANESETAQPPKKEAEAYWDKGFYIAAFDRALKIRIGGVFAGDWAELHPDAAVYSDFGKPQEHYWEYRFLRPFVEATLFDTAFIRFQYEFTSPGTVLDFYAGAKKIPALGRIRLGHQKEPFSMDQLISPTAFAFMERASTDVFAPARNVGLAMNNSWLDNRITLGAGVFNDSDRFENAFSPENRGVNVTSRITGLPWSGSADDEFVHLGFAYSHQFHDAEDGLPVRYAPRPEAHLADFRLVDTGKIKTEDVDLLNGELAASYGPVWFQGEYFQTFVEPQAGGTLQFSGFYASAGWIITGESRPFDRHSAVFKSVKPFKAFNPANFLNGGFGAVELAARYSHIDLNDSYVRGGVQDDITLGVNWHLCDHSRLVFNYVHAEVRDRDDSRAIDNGSVDSYMARFVFFF